MSITRDRIVSDSEVSPVGLIVIHPDNELGDQFAAAGDTFPVIEKYAAKYSFELSNEGELSDGDYWMISDFSNVRDSLKRVSDGLTSDLHIEIHRRNIEFSQLKIGFKLRHFAFNEDQQTVPFTFSLI